MQLRLWSLSRCLYIIADFATLKGSEHNWIKITPVSDCSNLKISKISYSANLREPYAQIKSSVFFAAGVVIWFHVESYLETFVKQNVNRALTSNTVVIFLNLRNKPCTGEIE